MNEISEKDLGEHNKQSVKLNRNGITRPLILYFGAKWRLAPRIIAHFPEHQIFTEAYGGGGAVLLSKNPCNKNEIYNDLNDEVVNLFWVMRNHPGELIRVLKRTPYAETEFNLAYKKTNNPIERARRLLIRSHFGFHSKSVFYVKTKINLYAKNRCNRATRFTGLARALPQIANRLRNVGICKREAIEVIKEYDTPETLHYVDPPYLLDTRRSANRYLYEMSSDQHRELLEVLLKVKGNVVLSGYANQLYDQLLNSWKRVTIPTTCFSAKYISYAEEVLWIKNK